MGEATHFTPWGSTGWLGEKEKEMCGNLVLLAGNHACWAVYGDNTLYSFKDEQLKKARDYVDDPGKNQ